MPYPTIDEFKEILRNEAIEAVVRDYVFQATPYVFRRERKSLDILRQHLCRRLDLNAENLIVVGSASLGFSLSPRKFPRRFFSGSDIDVVIVNAPLFDSIWLHVLGWNYPQRNRLIDIDWEWAKERVNDIYWGRFAPDRISNDTRFNRLSLPTNLIQLRRISTDWFNAFQSLSLYKEFASRKITGRLYRTWDHALLYHVSGFQQIKDNL